MNDAPFDLVTAFTGEALERCIEGTCDVIAQKFIEGVTIEEIAADWRLNLSGEDCVVVPRLILDILRLQLSRFYQPQERPEN